MLGECQLGAFFIDRVLAFFFFQNLYMRILSPHNFKLMEVAFRGAEHIQMAVSLTHLTLPTNREVSILLFALISKQHK